MDKKTGISGKNLTESDMDKFFDEIYELSQNGRRDEAIAKLDMFDENHPEYSRSLFYKAMISDDKDESMDILKELLESHLGEDIADFEIDYDNPDDLFAAGLSSYFIDDYEEAIEYFDSSLKLKPNQSEALYYKACCLGQMGRFKKALKVIEKAIKIDSADVRFWNEKGVYLTSLNHVSKAVKSFNKALKLAPEDPVIWANKGFLYLENEKYDKALECYDEACRLAPEDIHPIIGKADVYAAMEDFSTARKYLNMASEIDDEDLEYLESMGQFMISQEKYDKAMEYWDKCLEIDDENPMFWVHKAFCYGLMEEDEEFEKCLDRAVELDENIISVLDDFMNG